MIEIVSFECLPLSFLDLLDSESSCTIMFDDASIDVVAGIDESDDVCFLFVSTFLSG